MSFGGVECRWAAVQAVWQGIGVTNTPVEPAEWLNLPDIAERLGVPITKIHQMIREHALIAVRRDRILRVPAELVAGSTVLKHLPGILTLLHDAGYNDEEALEWLYTSDDSLPGTPAEVLNSPRAIEVKRRAQALGF